MKGEYEAGFPFSCNLASVAVRKKSTDPEELFLYGYINKKGKWIIKPQFEYATSFSEEIGIIGIHKDNKFK